MNSAKTRLGRLTPDEQFAYVFDFGDGWAQLCAVGGERIDPRDTFGITPAGARGVLGRRELPDQDGRRWDGADEMPEPSGPRVRWLICRRSCPVGRAVGSWPRLAGIGCPIGGTGCGLGQERNGCCRRASPLARGGW